MFKTIRQRFTFIAAILSAATLSACAGSDPITAVDEDYAAERLVIRDFIGTLTIETTQAGGDVSLHVEATEDQAELLPIDLAGGVLTIEWEGEPDRLRRWYEFWRGRWMADPNALEQYPTLVLAVPANVEIDIEGLIGHWTIDDREGHISFTAERGSGSIGALRSADIAISSDADLEVGPVRELLSASVAGSGSLSAGDSGRADVSLAGSGEILLGTVAGDLNISVSGSGSTVAGDAAHIDVAVSGSGSVRLGAADAGFLAVVQGSGSVTADRVDGEFQVSVSGSGRVVVDDGRGSPFEVSITGSGSVRFGGTAVDPIARISGSGGLILGAVEGELDAATAGAGRVQILR
jgi:hypothetical protein